MASNLIHGAVWPSLRKASTRSKGISWVAVAYFGDGADRLLKWRAGTRLVVDASTRTVRAGQCHPETLLRLLKRGVRVFSVSNLHAKVFVLGSRAYIGSANVSSSSEGQLLEAVVETSDKKLIAQARRFVKSLCLEELSPASLADLQKIYRPPLIHNRTNTVKSKRARRRAVTALLHLVQLKLMEWPEGEEAIQESGYETAKARKEHKTGWVVQTYRVSGRARVKRGELVVQVLDEGGRERLIEPPGKVLNVVRRHNSRGQFSYIYVEVKKVSRRPTVKSMARTLGRGAKKKLLGNGMVRDGEFAQKVLAYWGR